MEPVQAKLASLLKSVNAGDYPTDKGISLLEVKAHLMLNYLERMAYYLALKVQDKEVSEHRVVDELIESRLYLERIRPVEKKMKYQIDKLLRSIDSSLDAAHVHAAEGLPEDEDALAFRPNPAALERTTEELGSTEDQVYRPPRVAPMHFNEGPKEQRISAAAREKASKSRLLHELRTQYDALPEEQTAQGTGYGAREVGNELDEKWREREAFEEENMVRLNMTREDKKLRKLLDKKGSALRFQDDFANLEEDFLSIKGVAQSVEKEKRKRPVSDKIAKPVFGKDEYARQVKKVKSKRR